MSRIACALLCVLISSAFAYADVYRYVDADGVVTLTDTPTHGTQNKKALKQTYKIAYNTYTPAPQQPDYAVPSTSAPTASVRNKTSYKDLIRDHADRQSLDPLLLDAIITTESNFNPRAVSNKGAQGLMQLMPRTAAELGVLNPLDPAQNISGGTRYLKYLLGRFKGDLTLALAAYNAGPERVEKYGCVPPIKETRNYINRIYSLYKGAKTLKADVPAPTPPRDDVFKVVLADGTVLYTNSAYLNVSGNRYR